MRVSCFLQVTPVFSGDRLSGARVTKVTAKKPRTSSGVVLKVQLDIDDEVFLPMDTPVIKITKDMVPPQSVQAVRVKRSKP